MNLWKRLRGWGIPAIALMPTALWAEETTAPSVEDRLAAIEKRLGSGENALGVSWDNGIKIQSADKAFEARIGGRIQNDWAFFDVDDELMSEEHTWQDAVEFR